MEKNMENEMETGWICCCLDPTRGLGNPTPDVQQASRIGPWDRAG